MPSGFRLAHAWPGRHWPLPADDERQFISELRKGRSRIRSFDRNDITWLMTALRAGADAQTTVAVAVGVDPRRLSAAYDRLERERSSAEAAWIAICAARTQLAVHEHFENAARLLPVPVTRLRSARSDTELHRILDHLEAEIANVRSAIDAAYALVEQFAHDDLDEAQRYGRKLWCPSAGCLWNDPYLLPLRIGELSPMRVADLLGTPRREELT